MVVFTQRQPGSKWRWWHLLTSREFNHCYCVIETLGGCMKVDQNTSGMTFSEINGDLFDYIQYNYQDITSLYLFDIGINSEYNVTRGLISCVSVVKSILCYPIPRWVLTPKQLDRYLSMGNPFKKPKAPDTSAQERLLKEQANETKAQNEALQAEENKRLEALRRKRTGARSLLSGGQYDTLG